MVWSSSHHLRSRIARTSTCRPELLSLGINIPQPKIDDLDIPFGIKQQVLRLEIPMDNAQLMQILHSIENLLQNSGGLGLPQPGITHNIVE